MFEFHVLGKASGVQWTWPQKASSRSNTQLTTLTIAQMNRDKAQTLWLVQTPSHCEDKNKSVLRESEPERLQCLSLPYPLARMRNTNGRKLV